MSEYCVVYREIEGELVGEEGTKASPNIITKLVNNFGLFKIINYVYGLPEYDRYIRVYEIGDAVIDWPNG